MTNEEIYNGPFQDFERIIITSFDRSGKKKLLAALNEVVEEMRKLPPHNTIAMWLFNHGSDFCHMAVQYWILNKDEIALQGKFVSRVVKHIETYGDNVILTLKCRTDNLEGNAANLLEIAMKEIGENDVQTLQDISYSNTFEDAELMDITLRFYCRK